MSGSGSVPSIGSGNNARRSQGRADEIDYKIHGQEMQFVEIELDPGESTIAEAGSMMFKDPTIRMDTVFGDGAEQSTGSLAS